MNFDFAEITSHFTIAGTFSSAESYGNGHINDTFLVRTREDDKPDYIFQRINNSIFKDIPGLMSNVKKVTAFIRDELEHNGSINIDREVLTLLPADDNKPFFLDKDNNFWRAYIFISPNKSYDIVPDASIAFEGGRIFGKFQKYLSKLPGEELVETIPNFHNIEMRLDTYRSVYKKDIIGRAAQIKEENDFVEHRADKMCEILNAGNKGEIPLRVTHNDTKFNNILFDTKGSGLCVIDLDTIMPGYIHYDFGDAVRTAVNTASEDETDLSKVEMDMNIFKGFAQGFLSETKNILTKKEIEYLPISGELMTFTIGLRFLTDYLDGDRYFKTHREGQNLDRCRTQFKLIRSMETYRELIKQIIIDAAK